MKPNKALVFALIAFIPSFLSKAQQTPKVTPSGIGYLEYLPSGYQSGQEKYPVVISLHGYKEKGTSSTNVKQVLKDLPEVANVGLPKYVKFGQKYPFILISPQLKSHYGTWSPAFVMEVVNHVKKTLRIDEKRIYLTGLSLGGFGVWRTAGEYPGVFAAIAPICSGGNAIDKAGAIAKENVAVWGFHGSGDHIVSYTVTTNMISAINAAPKKPNPLAKVTIFPGKGHIIWDNAYQETNVLDWMLSFRKGSAPSPQQANNPPLVKAGDDKTVTLPDNSINLEGQVSDQDGEITSYSWTKMSGPEVKLSGATTPVLKAEDLSEGIYTFRLTAKDNDGASASDDVQLTVRASANKAPLVNAGADRTLTLPVEKISLTASASDPDGQIISYEWTKTSGSQAKLEGTQSPQLTITNVVAGTYVFRLTVKDNEGTQVSDEVTVSVKELASGNVSPVVNAGRDRSLMLPQNSLQLSASATDADGSISSYSWTKISGGAANIVGDASQNLSVSGLTKGTYIFKLTVKDNLGAMGEDAVTVVVRDAPQENHFSAEISPTGYDGEDKSSGLSTDLLKPVGIPWLSQ